ncbi:MAG: hypothetical protein QM504_10630 [Pseudomonadota bacterium]
MKSLYKLFLIAFLMFFSISLSMAQLTDPGDGGGDPDGGGHTPIGGSAPIGSGLAILIGLGAAYGSKKIYQLKLEEV